MQRRVKKFSIGINFFKAGIGKNRFELLLNHGDAGLQRRERIALRALRSRQRHFKIVENGQKFLEQRDIGKL